jgi:hypothetical protein
MPWSVRRRGSRYEVIQDDTGEVVGTHGSKERARAQQAALYSTEDEQKFWAGSSFSVRVDNPKTT